MLKKDPSFTFLKGKKQKKSKPVFGILGDLDELLAVLGLTKAFAISKNFKKQITFLQDDLVAIGGFLSGVKKIDLPEKINFLEEKIKVTDKFSIKAFSRPGINKTSAWLHLARTVCRRLERKLVSFKTSQKLLLVSYFNRLSFLLFLLACQQEKK